MSVRNTSVPALPRTVPPRRAGAVWSSRPVPSSQGREDATHMDAVAGELDVHVTLEDLLLELHGVPAAASRRMRSCLRVISTRI